MNVLHFLRAITLVALVVLLAASCQQATQPLELSAQRTITLEIRSTKNEPIPEALVDWLKFTGANAPIGARVVTGPDGYAQWLVPDVATTRDSVRLTINVPSTSPIGAIGPLVFTTALCNDTLLTIGVSGQTPCGTLNALDTILLETCPRAGRSSVSECVVFPSTCPDGLVYTAPDSSRGNIALSLRSSNNRSSTLDVCATYAPPVGSAVGTAEEYNVRIEGRAPNSADVLVAYDLVVIGRVLCETCPCPTIPAVAVTTTPVCIGSTEQIVVDLDALATPLTSRPGCVTDFTLKPTTNADVVVTSGDRFTLRSGQSFPLVDLQITPQNINQIQRRFVWAVQTRNLTTGVIETCPADFVVDVTTTVLAPACRILVRQLDTLQKCVFSDSSTTDTLSIVNDGDCPITVNIATVGLFQASPSGSVTIPPRSRQLVQVSFLADKLQWNANPSPPVPGRGDKFFNGTLTIDGCGNQQAIPLVGDAYVQCTAFKYQCLRQFRPTGFPNVYAESIQLVENKTNIVYQNDNQAFKQFDIFVRSLTPVGGSFTAELGSGGNGNVTFGVFRRIATGFSVRPGESICDTYPAGSETECDALKSDITRGTPAIAGLNAGDVVLFTKIGSTGLQCALIWIQSIGLDRPGPNALPQVCIEICYPMFEL